LSYKRLENKYNALISKV